MSAPAGQPLAHTHIDSPLGPLLLVADDALRAVYFAEHARRPPLGTLGREVAPSSTPVLRLAAEQLAAYFDATLTQFTLPCAPVGDEFSLATWEKLNAIPYGETTTYGAIAAELGTKNLARRVGQVVARNPLSIVVPCHRVVAASGALTGFAGGVERKRWLLELEAGV